MTFASLLADLVPRLERADVLYMVTGSIAGSFHGEPRSTLDLDLVIDPSAGQLLALLTELDRGGYDVATDAATAALADRTQFNAISADSAKVDFIIRHDRAFSREEFARRQAVELLGTKVELVTPEDLIIAKLEWSSSSGSERQLRDVADLVAINPDLDRAYVERWAEVLGVGDLWRRIAAEA